MSKVKEHIHAFVELEFPDVNNPYKVASGADVDPVQLNNYLNIQILSELRKMNSDNSAIESINKSNKTMKDILVFYLVLSIINIGLCLVGIIYYFSVIGNSAIK